MKRGIEHYFIQKREYWKEIYDKRKDAGQTFVSRNIRDRRDTVLRLLDEFAAGKRLNIVDIGCGTGELTKEILLRGHYVTGIDITEDMLAAASRRVSAEENERAQFIHGDLENMPVESGTVDAVVCVGVLQYQKEDEQGFREIARVLRNGGMALVTIPNIVRLTYLLDPYYYLVRGTKYLIVKALGNERASEGKGDYGLNRTFENRRYFYGQLKKHFNACGFEKTAQFGIGYGPMTFWRRSFMSDDISIRISKQIERLSMKRSFRFLHRYANRWVICLRKVTT